MNSPGTDEQLEIVRGILPELEIASIEQTRGQFNDVLIINQEFVFRFPRTHAGEAILRRESSILRSIRERISLAIPDPITDEDDAFMAYRLIPGKPLHRDLLQSPDADVQERVARQIATFLRETHRVPRDSLPPGLPTGEQPAGWRQFYEDVRADLYPHMRPAARESIDRHFADYFSGVASSGFEPVFRHGDMGPGNILCDPEQKLLSGIIDFGSATLGDPAQDVGGLMTNYGQSFIDRMAPHYPEIEDMHDRACFYIGTYALQQALAGLRDGDRETFEDGIAGFRQQSPECAAS